MKKNKLKIITITLLIVLITMVAFFGVYTQQKNKMVNSTKEFQYGMDIDSAITYKLALDSDNKDEDKTVENYNKVRNILEKRFKDINVNINQQNENNSNIETIKIKTEDYQINVNEDNGEIFVTLPNDDNSLYLSSLLSQNGKFEITDFDNKEEVYLTNEDIDKATLNTYTYGSQTAVSFRIEFNKQGKEKLQTVKEKYTGNANTEVAETNTENVTAEETAAETGETTTATETSNKLTFRMNGEDVYSDEYNKVFTNEAIVLSIGDVAKDNAALKSALAQGQALISVLSNETMPLTYKVDGSTIVASTEKEDVTGLILIFTGFIWLIMTVFFVIRYKKLGLMASIAFLGFVSLLLLAIKYLNVVVSTEGIVSLFIVLLLNITILDSIVKTMIKEKDNKKLEPKNIINNEIKESIFKLIPLFILAVVFAFVNKTPASSFGMVMFWGLALIIVYNLFVTKTLLKDSNLKKKN